MGRVDDPSDIPDRGGNPLPSVRLGAIGEGWGLFVARWDVWMLAAGLALICHAGVLGLVSALFGIDSAWRVGGFRMPFRPGGGGAVQTALAMAVNGFFL